MELVYYGRHNGIQNCKSDRQFTAKGPQLAPSPPVAPAAAATSAPSPPPPLQERASNDQQMHLNCSNNVACVFAVRTGTVCLRGALSTGHERLCRHSHHVQCTSPAPRLTLQLGRLLLYAAVPHRLEGGLGKVHCRLQQAARILWLCACKRNSADTNPFHTAFQNNSCWDLRCHAGAIAAGLEYCLEPQDQQIPNQNHPAIPLT